MSNIISNVSIVISGINLKDNFQISKSIHQEYISEINCSKLENDTISIKCKVTSSNKNTNYLAANNFKEFILNLFSLFGTSRLDKFHIDTNSDFLDCEIEVRPPLPEVSGDDINSQVDNVVNSFSDAQMNGIFHNLVESHQGINMIHRFRSLFSVFDSLSPKNSSDHIDYKKLQKLFSEEIKERYKDFNVSRYITIINEFTKGNLIDIRANKNYSHQLQIEMSKLNKGEFINENVSFNIMKCIQIIRNNLNHGNFTDLNRIIVAGAYELLLVITQKLIRK